MSGPPDPAGDADAVRPVRRVGDRALLVECRDGAEVRGLRATLDADPPAGLVELLPGARTLLAHLTPAAAADPRVADRLGHMLAGLPALAALPDGDRSAEGEDVVVDTVYDGEDLDDVAAALGTSPAGVVAAHVDRVWTASFVGFAPGFAYLEPDGGPFDAPFGPPFDVPRRGSPRTAVPAGSVALAGPYSAVYPRRSPGGWQLVGRTAAVLWDLARPEPALVRAGTRVRFRAVREVVVAGGVAVGTRVSTSPPAPSGVPSLEVVATGPLALVEDLGRPGHLDRGVGASGALDRGAAVRANRLVGNPRGAAVVETVLGGLTLRAHGPLVLAVTGAPAPLTVLAADGAERVHPRTGRPFPLHDGERVRLGVPASGLRSYVAVRGGLGVEPVLGSRSTDVLSGLGPPPLQPGDVLSVLAPPPDAVAAWPDEPDAREASDQPTGGATPPAVEVRVRRGPRADRLTRTGLERLTAATWTVSAQSDRVGLRLEGEPLEHASADELPSEGVVLGAVQVPPSGLPVVFLADHPVSGGYPVVAVVHDGDVDRLAQVRPGERLHLVLDDDRP